MAGADKRAKLLSDLLAAKGDASGGGSGPAEPERAPVIHIAERRQSEDRPSETPSAPNVLYNKGAATASTFRPSYWSFDHQQAAEPSAAPARAEPTLPADEVRAPKRLPVNLVIGFGCVALMISTTLFVVSLWKRPEAPALQPQVLAAATTKEPVVALPPQPQPQPQPQPVAAPPAAAAPSVSAPASVATEAPPPAVAAPEPQSPVSPVPSVAAAPTPRPNTETDALLARGDDLLATGDVAAARLFYQRAAEQGNAAAATAVGQTYDPAILDLLHVRGVRGDAQLAAEWYRKAMAAGDPHAEIRLKRLQARTPG